MRPRLPLLLLLLATPALPAGAQAPPPREIRSNTNAWLMYFGDHRVARRWSVWFDGQLRRSDLGAAPMQVLLRPGVAFDLSPSVRLFAGYAFIQTSPYGEFRAPFAFPEHRTWQQLLVTHAAGRVGLAHRYRLEQRWVGRVDSVAGRTTPTVQEWVGSGRLRYFVRATVPLGAPTITTGRPYLAAYNEVFVKWGSRSDNSLFDQNRLYGAVGLQVAAGWRLEVGYLNQLIARNAGSRLELNHTLQLGVFSSAPLH